MANSFQTITTGLAELKNYYEGPIKDQFSEDCPIYRGAEKQKKGWSGQQVIRPVRVRRNQGIGATSDGGNLPAIGKQVPVQAIISSAYNYLRFGVTGPMIKASQSDAGSFVRSAAYELEMGYKDLMNDCNRQVAWDGTGTLAKLNANATASNVITIKGRESTDAALRWIDVGIQIDIYSGSGPTYSAQSVNVTAITGGPSDLTATLTLDQNVTCSTNDQVIRAGSGGQEMDGLTYSLDGGTSTIYNVNRLTYPAFQGNLTTTTGQLTLDLMQQPYNAGLRRGGAKYSAIYSDFDSLRYYQKLLTADKRFSNTIKGDGGFAQKDKFYLDFNGIPIVPDKDSPVRFFFLPEDAFTFYVLAEMEFADETGSMYIAQTSTDSFEVRVRFFANLFNEQPAACGALSGYLSP